MGGRSGVGSCWPGSCRRRHRSRPPTTPWSRPVTASPTSSRSCPPRDEATERSSDAGVGPLWQKIAIWRPAAVVFIYKRAAAIAAGRELTEPWGDLEGVALAGRPCVLMPGPYATTEQVDEGVNLLRNLASSLPIDRA